MADADPLVVVDNHAILTRHFGGWPSFHDAEIMEINLWRGRVQSGEWEDNNVFTVLTAKIRILEATQLGARDTGHDTLATLRFHDVDELQLHGFNHVNQILGLSFRIQPRGTFTDGTPLPPYIMVDFKTGFGAAISFKCFRVAVIEAVPFLDGIG